MPLFWEKKATTVSQLPDCTHQPPNVWALGARLPANRYR
jgi:hypothetical protein